jgi:hypothetical protein
MNLAIPASRRASAVIAVIAFALTLAACGGDDDDKSTTSNAQSGLEKRIDAAEKRAKAEPTSPAPLAELAKLHFQSATLKREGVGYSDAGKDELREATKAWQRYIALEPKRVDTDVAQLISAAYGPGALDDPRRAVRVQEVLAENTSPPRAGAYVQLAQMAYSAGERRIGDVAAKRAVELSKPARRDKLRKRLKAARSQLAP